MVRRHRLILLCGASLLLLSVPGCKTSKQAVPCHVHQSQVEFYHQSVLKAGARATLQLTRGAPLRCDHPSVSAMLLPLTEALSTFPHLPVLKHLRVHLSPALPDSHSPIRGAEVHLSSREILIGEAQGAVLTPRLWRHELAHVVAIAPPSDPLVARRIWLTLEEALAAYVGDPHTRPAAETGAPFTSHPSVHWQGLAGAQYDPHPLGESLRLRLASQGPAFDEGDALACLSSARLPREADSTLGALRSTIVAFVARCPEAAQGSIREALRQWLPEELALPKRPPISD